jgi:hypothetical protein
LLPDIGAIVAVYAVARLVQIPIEASGFPRRWLALLVVSLIGIALIGFAFVDLMMRGTDLSIPSL